MFSIRSALLLRQEQSDWDRVYKASRVTQTRNGAEEALRSGMLDTCADGTVGLPD